MPFTPTPTSEQLSDIRANYSGAMYLALCPNAVVWRTQPSTGGLTGLVYAQFDCDGTLAGDFNDVQIGQTFIIHTVEADLTTEIYRGRVRLAPEAGVGDIVTFFVNESSFGISDSYYVTVINSYDIVPRLARFTTQQLIDWSSTPTTLPPLISGLQSSYVVFTPSATVTVSFAPTGQAIEDGATISSWLWDVDDGTITVGTSTTKDISVSFPKGHRWVRVTVTDSEGVSNFFVFEVYVVDNTSASLVKGIRDINIGREIDGGANADLTVYETIDDVLKDTRATLFSVENTGTTTSINTNINFVGYTRNEDNAIRADDTYSLITESRLTIEGFVTRLATIPAQPVRLQNSASPTLWGDTAKATPSKMVAYLLSCYTTYTNISAVSVLDDTDYEFSPLVNAEADMLTASNDILDSYNARLNFANSGETNVSRMAVYLPSASRSALPTIVTFGQSDMYSYDVQVDYVRPIGQVLVSGASWRNATSQPTIYQGRAPAISKGSGYETAELNGQILEAGAVDSDARIDISTRSANHLAYSNPTDVISVNLRAGWHFIAPHVAQWYKFNITDTGTRGLPFDSDTRWVLQSINFTADNELGTRNVFATFRRETESTGAQIVVARIPSQSDSPLPTMPLLPDYPALNTNSGIFYPTDTPTFDELQPFNPNTGAQLLPLPTEDADNVAQPSSPECDQLQIWFNSGAVGSTARRTVDTEDYAVSVRGQAKVGSGNITQSTDFTVTNGGYETRTIGLGLTPAGTYALGVGWQTSDYTQSDGGLCRGVRIRFSFGGDVTVMSLSMTFDFARGTYQNPTLGAQSVVCIKDGSAVSSNVVTFEDTVTGDDQTLTDTIVGGVVCDEIRLTLRPHLNIPSISRTGSGLIKSVTVVTQGSSGDNFADAFYFYEEGGVNPQVQIGTGLFINALKPTIIPDYNPTGEYTFTFTPAINSPMQFQYLDSNYADNEVKPLTIRVCGDLIPV